MAGTVSIRLQSGAMLDSDNPADARVKCGECPNQAFLPVEDRVILDHLQGRNACADTEPSAMREMRCPVSPRT